jgi:hypothetical protein
VLVCLLSINNLYLDGLVALFKTAFHRALEKIKEESNSSWLLLFSYIVLGTFMPSLEKGS